MSGYWKLLVAALAVLALGSASCAGDATGSGLQPGERTIYMAAIEPKGSASVDDEPFPTQPLPEGGGYGLAMSDEEPGVWEVDTYRWLPGTVTVVEGDNVTLEVLGVNGASHSATIEGYGIDFEVNRGQLTTVDFVADKPGIYSIVCSSHQPAMTGTLVVLPSS